MTPWLGKGRPPTGRVKVQFRGMSWGLRQGRRSQGKESYTGDASIFDWEHKPHADSGREDIIAWAPAVKGRIRIPTFRVTLTVKNGAIAANLAQRLGYEPTRAELADEVRRIIHEANT